MINDVVVTRPPLPGQAQHDPPAQHAHLGIIWSNSEDHQGQLQGGGEERDAPNLQGVRQVPGGQLSSLERDN